MITINKSPVRGGPKTTASISADVLMLNGEQFNLAETVQPFLDELVVMEALTDEDLVDFERLPNPLQITKTGDDYELTIPVTHGSTAAQETLFPKSIETNGDWALDYEYDINVNKLRKEKKDKKLKERKAK